MALKGQIPDDVEGFEFEVIRGATKSLQNEALQAIIIEMQGHENRYENTYGDVHNILIKNRFYPFVYDPINRTFKSKDGYNLDKFNTIYLRNTEFVQRRVEEASSFKVLNKTI